MNEFQCYRITTGARLHFGLLDTQKPFGGCGLMIDRPQTVVEVQRLSEGANSTCEGPGAERAQAILDRLADYFRPQPLPPLSIKILTRPLTHQGLGTGTQLGLAVADAIAKALGVKLDETTLALEIAQRGFRSAVGVHGYFQGGLIVEKPTSQAAPQASTLNPIAARIELPSSWSVALFQPKTEVTTIAGSVEKAHFESLPRATDEQKTELLRLLDQQLIPAAVAGDFESFSEAVFAYNYLSGTLFAPVQGGAYNGADIEYWVQHLRSLNIRGVGQSSWGKTVFAFCENDEQAAQLQQLQDNQWRCVEVAKPSQPAG